MKNVYILISFTLMNVLVTLDDYVKQVIMLNQQIIVIGDHLPGVITDVVLSKDFNMVELALMFAVPDAEDKEVDDYIKQQRIDYQRIALENINAFTLIDASPIAEGEFEDAKLTDLACERRELTIGSIKYLIRDIIGGGNESFRDFLGICRLLGLYRSVKYPDSFIVAADVDEKENCHVVDKNGNSTIYYYIENDIWEFDANGTSFRGKPLSSQLEKP